MASWPRTDSLVIGQKLEELARIEEQLDTITTEFMTAYANCPKARRVDAIRGIEGDGGGINRGTNGPVERFRNAEQLISFAGLAPGIQESDRTRRSGHIGGGGTDAHLRHYLIEASIWARTLPRYKPAYERIQKRKGAKVGRVVVARMLLRSIYKIFKEGVSFDAGEVKPVSSTAVR